MIRWAYNTALRIPGGFGPPIRPSVSFAIAAAEVCVIDGDSVPAGAVNPSGSHDATYACYLPFSTAVIAAFTGAGKTPPTFVNVAVGGRTTADTLANIATAIGHAPDHYFLCDAANDPLHGISPATSGANVVAIANAIWQTRPTCRVHVMPPLWGSGEHWPDGSNPEDASLDATGAGIMAAVAPLTLIKVYNFRPSLFASVEPVQNPANLASGQLVQPSGGYHPTKVATPPATISGIEAVSNFMLANVPLNLA